METKLPELPYAYDALEPHIDVQTMKIHHDKHHQAYFDKLKAALEPYPELQAKSVEELLQNLNEVPEDIRTAVKNNGGGHYHHSLFWQMMKPDGGGEPAEKLAKALEEEFGSFTEFKKQFTEMFQTHFGSGWAWLVKDSNSKLQIVSTANQDSPISEGQQPLLGIDVREHAYYLQYQNKRPEYIEAWWQVINWGEVGRLYGK